MTVAPTLSSTYNSTMDILQKQEVWHDHKRCGKRELHNHTSHEPASWDDRQMPGAREICVRKPNWCFCHDQIKQTNVADNKEFEMVLRCAKTDDITNVSVAEDHNIHIIPKLRWRECTTIKNILPQRRVG